MSSLAPQETLAVPVAQFRRPAWGTSGAFKLLLLFLLFLYLNPALYVPAIAPLHPTEIVALVALLLLVIDRTSSGALRIGGPEGYLLLCFFGAAALSCLSAFWMQLAVDSLEDLARIVLIYLLIVNTVDSVDRLRTVVWVFVIGGLFPALGTINNHLHGNLVEGTRAHWIGVFGNPNELAYCLVILVPLAAALAMDAGWLKRLILFGTIAVYVAAIYLTYSRGSLLGLFAVLGLLLLRQRSVLAIGMVLGLAVAIAIFMSYYWQRDSGGFTDVTQDYTFQQRIATDEAGLAMFADRPLTGVGINCSVVAYPIYAPGDFYFKGALVTHNTLIQVLSETGIIGFVPYLLFLLVGVKHACTAAVSMGKSDRSAIAHIPACLGIALVGFFICGLSGGYVMSWFPYLFVGLISSANAIHI